MRLLQRVQPLAHFVASSPTSSPSYATGPYSASCRSVDADADADADEAAALPASDDGRVRLPEGSRAQLLLLRRLKLCHALLQLADALLQLTNTLLERGHLRGVALHRSRFRQRLPEQRVELHRQKSERVATRRALSHGTAGVAE